MTVDGDQDTWDTVFAEELLLFLLIIAHFALDCMRLMSAPIYLISVLKVVDGRLPLEAKKLGKSLGEVMKGG